MFVCKGPQDSSLLLYEFCTACILVLALLKANVYIGCVARLHYKCLSLAFSSYVKKRMEETQWLTAENPLNLGLTLIVTF